MTRDTTIQLRHLFEIVSGSTPDSGNADYWDGDIAWVTPEDVSQVDGNVLRDTRRKLTAEGFANSGTTMARTGAIVLTKRAPIGQLALLGLDACSNQGCFLLSARKGTEPRFFYYVLASRVPLLQALGRGSTFMELSTDDLKALRVPMLDYDRQVRIANYLDATLAKIDQLLQSNRGLLEILAEKRKAIIATAVTRGLDPNVKLRHSGVPWLGDMPAHWEIERARWLFRERDVRSATGDEKMLTVSHLTGVTPRSEKDVNMFEAETNEGYKLCQPGDLVINTLWAWMGAMGTAPVKGIVSPAYNVYEPDPRITPAYVDALVRLPMFAQEVTRYSKGVWSSRLRLYPDGFFEVYLPVPPEKEQRVIVEQIARETAKLDAVREATEQTIALLTERLSALITAAVTGQLDGKAAA
ncbi:MAG TPA: restriction endonuclease subunit S [Thermoanaerobaculia bacterium]